jgi:hypothetical protein
MATVRQRLSFVDYKDPFMHGEVAGEARPGAILSILNSRSQFLAACETAIRERRAELDAGGMVHVDLQEGGYDGHVTVTIRPTDRTAFGTDWESPDPTRFPARIRAAATALLNCHCHGRFEVSHSDGSLTIHSV